MYVYYCRTSGYEKTLSGGSLSLGGTYKTYEWFGHSTCGALSVGLTSVRQKGGLPGPPPFGPLARNPRPRIPRRPGALCNALMPVSESRSEWSESESLWRIVCLLRDTTSRGPACAFESGTLAFGGCAFFLFAFFKFFASHGEVTVQS